MSKFEEAFHKKMERLYTERLEGDGEDPRIKTGRHKLQNRKALQLCNQVFQALALSLTDSDDPVMHGLSLMSVELCPDSTQLLVIVKAEPGMEQEVLASLNAEKGRLRTAIAESINRKKTPQLKFQVI